MEQRIVDYIKKELGKGFSEKQIRQALLEAGHPAEAIEESFRYAKEKPLMGEKKPQLAKQGKVESGKPGQKKINEGLVASIKEKSDEGFSGEQIREALKEEGHPEESIDRHLEHYDKMVRPFEQRDGFRWERLLYKRYVVAFLILAIAIVITFLFVIPEYRFDGYMSQGNTLVSQGDYTGALAKYQRAYGIQPQNAEVLRRLGATYLYLAMPAEALQKYEELTRVAPDNFRGYAGTGLAYVGLKNYAESTGFFQKALDLNPTGYEYDIYRNLGRAFAGLGNYAEAERYYLKSLEYNRTARTLKEIGRMYLTAKNYLQAENYLWEAFNLEPQNWDTLLWVCRAYLWQGDVNRSLACLPRFIENNPNDIRGHAELARAYYLSQNYNGAIQEYITYLSMPNPEALYLYNRSLVDLGDSYYRIGDYENAAKWYEKAFEVNPNNYDALATVGRVYFSKGMDEEARKLFEERMSSDPSNYVALEGLGRYYLRQRQFDKSLDSYRKSVTLKPDYALGYFGLGVAYMESGFYKEAEENFLQTISLSKDRPMCTYYAYLGLAYYHENIMDAARENLDKALEVDSQCRDAGELRTKLSLQ